MRNLKIDEAGHIVVKHLSAFWIPEIKIEREIHGTVYTSPAVTTEGSFPTGNSPAPC